MGIPGKKKSITANNQPKATPTSVGVIVGTDVGFSKMSSS